MVIPEFRVFIKDATKVFTSIHKINRLSADCGQEPKATSISLVLVTCISRQALWHQSMNSWRFCSRGHGQDYCVIDILNQTGGGLCGAAAISAEDADQW